MTVADIPDRPQVVRVTPELAQDWLDNRNLSQNRTPSRHMVAKYADAMAEGRWLVTHQGIAFDRDGFLIDGQHRLAAVVAVGMPIDMMVTPGCDPQSFAVLDTGYRRQAAHFIPINGNVIAAAARVIGTVTGAWNVRSALGGVYDIHATNDQILDVVTDWQKEFDAYAPLVTQCYVKAKVNKSFHLAVLAQAARTRYGDRIESWLDGLGTGENLAADDPRLHLRNRYMREFRALNTGAGRNTAYRLIVRAWNAYATQRPVRVLRPYEDQPAPEVVA